MIGSAFGATNVNVGDRKRNQDMMYHIALEITNDLGKMMSTTKRQSYKDWVAVVEEEIADIKASPLKAEKVELLWVEEYAYDGRFADYT